MTCSWPEVSHLQLIAEAAVVAAAAVLLFFVVSCCQGNGSALWSNICLSLAWVQIIFTTSDSLKQGNSGLRILGHEIPDGLSRRKKRNRKRDECITAGQLSENVRLTRQHLEQMYKAWLSFRLEHFILFDFFSSVHNWHTKKKKIVCL